MDVEQCALEIMLRQNRAGLRIADKIRALECDGRVETIGLYKWHLVSRNADRHSSREHPTRNHHNCGLIVSNLSMLI